MSTVALTCKLCDITRIVVDRPLNGKPMRFWWVEDAKEICSQCRDAALKAGSPDPRLAPALPDPRTPVAGKVSAKHPQTSHNAAANVGPKSGTQKWNALMALADAYPDGLTAYEIADHLKRSPNQTATRLMELREQGWVEYMLDDNGVRVERPTTPGNTGLVQRLTRMAATSSLLRDAVAS